MKLESVPPVTVTSEATKLVEASLRVKVREVVSPAIRLVLVELKAIVGTTVSTAKVIKLFVSAPSALALPAAEDMHGISQLLTRRMEVDSAIGLVRGAVLERHRKLNQEQIPTPASPIPVASAVPTTSEISVSSPRKISVRRRYTLSDQPALSETIANLQTSLGDLQSRSITEVSVDLE